MMGIMVPETSWASNKICNKNHVLHLVGILFPHINDDARSKSLQICMRTIYFHFIQWIRWKWCFQSSHVQRILQWLVDNTVRNWRTIENRTCLAQSSYNNKKLQQLGNRKHINFRRVKCYSPLPNTLIHTHTHTHTSTPRLSVIHLHTWKSIQHFCLKINLHQNSPKIF